MGVSTVINDSIDKKLLDMNVAYIAKVLSTDGKKAKIQPLGMIKQVGESARAKAPIPDVPIIQSARYKLVEKEITYVSDVSVDAPKSSVVSSVTLDKTTGTISYVVDVSLSTTTDGEGDISSVTLDKNASKSKYVYDVSLNSSDGEAVSSVTVTPTKKTQKILVKEPIAVGDLVYCVCADRNITDSIKGINGVPPIGHHSLSDSIIVGIL